MKILFAQGNLLRKKEFQVQTIIYQEKNNYFVKKEAVVSEAYPHLTKILENYFLLKKIKLNLPKLINSKRNNLVLEYLNYPSLSKLIEDALYEKNYLEVEKLSKLIYEFANSLPQTNTNLDKNINFKKTFKKNLFTDDCLKIGILDLNADNILYNKRNNKFYLVDWEWLFDFPIPLDFILIRTYFYLSLHLQSLLIISANKNFPLYEILKNFYMPKIFVDKLNLNPQKLEKFFQMEYHFQAYVNIYNLTPKENDFLEKFNLINSCDFKYQYFLKNALFKIQSSKTYKLWQAYCKIRDKILKKFQL